MSTLDDMRKKGGTPEEFKKACGDALVQGFITLDEAEAASEKYRLEWDLVQVRSEARWLRVENERLADGFGTLAARCAKLEKEVKDHAEWARRVATDPEFVPAREIIKELAAVENEVKRLIDQEIKIKSLEAEAKRLGKENADLKVCLEGANQVVLSSAREAEALATKVEELQSARERDGSEMRETLKFEANLQKTIAQVRLNAGKERDEALAKAKALRRANDTKASAE